MDDVLKLSFIRRLVSNEKGATAIEYGLIAALIAIIIVGSLSTVGARLKNTFNTISSAL
jgi:pilus assembly protein Flp/PilA